MSIEKIQHKISQSEVKFGIISLRTSDGTKQVFSDLPSRFTVRLRQEILLERKIARSTIWIGFTKMKIFEPGETVNMMKYGDEIIIE